MNLWIIVACLILWRPIAFSSGLVVSVVYVGAFQLWRVVRWLAGY